MFNGDRLFMIPSATPLQCMGFVLEGEGDVIGIDSCTRAESQRLEDLVLSAVNEAIRQADEMYNSEMSKITGGMGGMF